MSDFQVGEVVDITIKGARVSGISNLDHCELDMTYTCASGEYLIQLPLGARGVDIERVAPAEWPPQPGDLWRDRLGSVWFALGRRVLMVPGDPVGDLGGYEPDKVLAKVGPLTLVHREGGEQR